MNKPYFVLLTGGKNNAGDYLIKERAKALLNKYRPDRELIDIDGYRCLSDDQLEVINNAEALLLTGGPALHKNMYPGVYQLRSDLDEIKVPITSLGIGWHSGKGHWADTHDYELSEESLILIDRIKRDGLPMSVRDYHTQNVLFNKGVANVVMTGCPALYTDKDGSERKNESINKVAFSLGVSFKNSPLMFRQMQEVLLELIERYGKEKVEVVFHHGLVRGGGSVEGVTKRLSEAQSKYLSWLGLEGVSYVDISGSAENLIDYYKGVDVHVGYRVHAHIYMSSINKPSVLISEDGRGMGLERVIGGMILPGFINVSENKIVERLYRTGLPVDAFKPVNNIATDIINMLNVELTSGVRLKQVQSNIQLHRDQMLNFLKALP